jgi:hypothetical protein
MFVAAAALMGCGDDSAQCTKGSDCPSGACRANGTCVPLGPDGQTFGGDTGDAGWQEDVSAPDGDTGASGDADVTADTAAAPDTGHDDTGAPPEDAAPDATPDIAQDAADATSDDTGAETDGGSPGVCVPNKDGVIERAEMPLAAGLHATYKVALDATFDTKGTTEGGETVWDLAQPFTGETSVLVEARPMEGAWFAEDFPTATYAARLSETEDLLGVFEVTDTALLLLGVVSIEDDLTVTNLEYDPPVETLKFPIEKGKSWSTSTFVSGTAAGVPFTMYNEEYTSSVDASGTLKTPFSDFLVLRVNVELVRTIGIVPNTIRTHMYVTECFGTVGTVVSEDHELESEFTDVKELRRLAP